MNAYERMGARIDRQGAARREEERQRLLAGSRFRVGDRVAFTARAAGFPYPGEMSGEVVSVAVHASGAIVASVETPEGDAVALRESDLRAADPITEALDRVGARVSRP